jgi:hypothetical protein
VGLPTNISSVGAKPLLYLISATAPNTPNATSTLPKAGDLLLCTNVGAVGSANYTALNSILGYCFKVINTSTLSPAVSLKTAAIGGTIITLALKLVNSFSGNNLITPLIPPTANYSGITFVNLGSATTYTPPYVLNSAGSLASSYWNAVADGQKIGINATSAGIFNVNLPIGSTLNGSTLLPPYIAATRYYYNQGGAIDGFTVLTNVTSTGFILNTGTGYPTPVWDSLPGAVTGVMVY